jgi:hypothetical protein
MSSPLLLTGLVAHQLYQETHGFLFIGSNLGELITGVTQFRENLGAMK